MTNTQFFILYLGLAGGSLILVINLFFWFLYRNEFPFIEQYKIEKDQPWPWKTDPEGWRKIVKKAIIVTLFNNTVVSLSGITLLACAFNWQVPWTVHGEIPSSLQMVKHIGICLVTEDFCFHMGHRFLHQKWIYKHIHKWHHEFKQPISISGDYFHPVEFVISGMIPSFSGLILLQGKIHLWTIMIWGIIRYADAHDGHSGYEFPWNMLRLMPFGSDATYHHFHHTHNVGNYSSFMTVWDTVFNSNVEFYKA